MASEDQSFPSKAESSSCNIKGKPKNIPSRLWEKFKSLEKRTDETTKLSTDKRVKHLQKQVMETVTTEFTSPEDKDILRDYDVKFGPPVEIQISKKRKAKDNTSSECEKQNGVDSEPRSFKTLSDLPKDLSRPPPPTLLETKINAAITSGDFVQAESLSDKMSDREAAEKMVEVIDAKNYLAQQKLKEAELKPNKKKKLAWGFEPKNRWETKGNM